MAFLFISLLLMFLYAIQKERTVTSPLERVLLTPVAAMQQFRNGVMGIFTEIAENFRAKKELNRLQAKVEELQRENGRLMYRLRRFEAYRSALNLPEEEELPTLPAIVLHHDDRLTRSFVINRGREDGVDVNMAVMTGEGLVGRITKSITDHAAKVQPLTSPQSRFGVYVEGTLYEGVVRGTDEEEYLILSDLHQMGLPDEANFPSPGQAVYTSGRGMVFPRNLLVGIISDATAPQGIIVEPAVDINTVQSVLVITNSKQREEILLLMSED
ncbi:MAG: rod shape-determining protein MreC [bacterium]|nr:rod shape-determining protein MreC [bacterium]